nr:MAG TPA: hypothetical protein [Microviridae sp.]
MERSDFLIGASPLRYFSATARKGKTYLPCRVYTPLYTSTC